MVFSERPAGIDPGPRRRIYDVFTHLPLFPITFIMGTAKLIGILVVDVHYKSEQINNELKYWNTADPNDICLFNMGEVIWQGFFLSAPIADILRWPIIDKFRWQKPLSVS